MTPSELTYAMAFERLCTAYGLTHCAITWREVQR